jgi:hypothetical protein
VIQEGLENMSDKHREPVAMDQVERYIVERKMGGYLVRRILYISSSEKGYYLVLLVA